ncbi:hypothetical protein X975_00451, partial [Stegodyphus mimosarum]
MMRSNIKLPMVENRFLCRSKLLPTTDRAHCPMITGRTTVPLS